jgi:hypothetical protein
MEYFAQTYGKVAFMPKLGSYYNKIPPNLNIYQITIVDDAKAKDSANHVKASLDGLDIKTLRNKYLHLTAYRESGQSGIKDWLINRGRYPERAIIDDFQNT